MKTPWLCLVTVSFSQRGWYPESAITPFADRGQCAIAKKGTVARQTRICGAHKHLTFSLLIQFKKWYVNNSWLTCCMLSHWYNPYRKFPGRVCVPSVGLVSVGWKWRGQSSVLSSILPRWPGACCWAAVQAWARSLKWGLWRSDVLMWWAWHFCTLWVLVQKWPGILAARQSREWMSVAIGAGRTAGVLLITSVMEKAARSLIKISKCFKQLLDFISIFQCVTPKLTCRLACCHTRQGYCSPTETASCPGRCCYCCSCFYGWDETGCFHVVALVPATATFPAPWEKERET